MKKINGWAVGVLTLALMLSACGNKSENKKDAKGRAAIPVTVTTVEVGVMPVLEESVGILESQADPLLAAEIPGKVVEIRALVGDTVKAGQILAVLDTQDAGLSRQAAIAEKERVQTLVDNQTKNVERQQQIHDKNFNSQAMLDDAQAQLKVLQNQLNGAKTQVAIAERSLGKTNIVAPFDGKIDRQIAVRGQYVKVGDPLFQLVAQGKLRARLPFPETMASKLALGMTVNLSSFMDGTEIVGKISSLRPTTGVNNRAIDALVLIDQAPTWHPGATVTGQVVLGQHRNALLLPQHTVVLRPAGKVVYVVDGDKAKQQIVTTGLTHQGKVEILTGLTGSESVVVDGAGFLTDQAMLNVTGQLGNQAKSPLPASAPVAPRP